MNIGYEPSCQDWIKKRDLLGRTARRIIFSLLVGGTLFYTGQVRAEIETPKEEVRVRMTSSDIYQSINILRKSIEEYDIYFLRVKEYFDQIQIENQKRIAGNVGVFSTDFSPLDEDLDGFVYYQVPEKFVKAHGYLPLIAQQYLWVQCQENQLDYAIVLGLIELESGYNHMAISSAKCVGYMQINISANRKRIHFLGCSDMMNPYENIKVGCSLLGDLLRKYKNYEKALTCYNRGEGGAKGVKTSWYAKDVLKRAQRIKKDIE